MGWSRSTTIYSIAVSTAPAVLLLCALIHVFPLSAQQRRVDALQRTAQPLTLSRVRVISDSLGGGRFLQTAAALLPLDDGVIIADREGAAVYRITESTGAVKTIGSRGEGPGEFRAPSGLGWHESGYFVRDPRANRITLYDHDDALIAAYTPPASPLVHGAFRTLPRSVLPNGGFAVMPALDPAAIDNGLVDSAPLLLLSSDGVATDTLTWFGLLNAHIVWSGSGGSLYMRQPFDDTSRGAASADGQRFVIARPSTTMTAGDPRYSVVAFDWRGDKRFAVAVPYTPQPLTDAHISTVADSLAAQLSPAARESHLSATGCTVGECI